MQFAQTNLDYANHATRLSQAEHEFWESVKADNSKQIELYRFAELY